MDACEGSCAAARAPSFRHEIDIVQYRPGEKSKKVGTQNKLDVVSMGFEKVPLRGCFHVDHDT